MKTELELEPEITIVPFAPPIDVHVTNGAPCGRGPLAVTMSWARSVPGLSGLVKSLN